MTSHKTEVKLAELFVTTLWVGGLGMGAAASDLAHKQFVEKRQWLTADRFAECVGVAGLVPGPFHINLMSTLGNAVGGWRGGVASVAGFLVPGFCLLLIGAIFLASSDLVRGLNLAGIAAGAKLAIAVLLGHLIWQLRLVEAPIYFFGTVVILGAAGFWWQMPFFAIVIGSGFLYVVAGTRFGGRK